MKHIDNTDAITNSQNEGIPCPHCYCRFGHYSRCPTLSFDGRNAYAQVDALREKLAAVEPTFTEDDCIRAHALGVVL